MYIQRGNGTPALAPPLLPMSLQMDDASSDWMDSVDQISFPDYWEVVWQGNYLKVKSPNHTKRGGGSRKYRPITEFSRKARFRMLQMVGKIDWNEIPDCLFLTLTWPDDVVHVDVEKRNRERYRFHRSVEEYCKREVSGVWRVEWQPRKSGTHKGNIYPHIHLMLFGVRYIPAKLIRQWWKGIIGSEETPRIDVQRVKRGEGPALYVSKYCGKVNDQCNLVNVPYLNKTGRHYGFMRQAKIKRHEKHTWHVRNAEIIKWLRKAASSKLGWYDLSIDSGFTLLGEFAELLGQRIEKIALDKGMWND